MEYSLRIDISGHDAGKIEAIKDAANEQWEFKADDWHEYFGDLTATAEGLGTSESDEDIMVRMSAAVWTANGKFCDVSVEIENLDTDHHVPYSIDETDYERIMAEIKDGANPSSALLLPLKAKTPMSNALKHSGEIQKFVESAFINAPSFEKAIEVWAEAADLVRHVKCGNPAIESAAGWIKEGVQLGIIAEKMRSNVYEVHIERSTSQHDGEEVWFYFCGDEWQIVKKLKYALQQHLKRMALKDKSKNSDSAGK